MTPQDLDQLWARIVRNRDRYCFVCWHRPYYGVEFDAAHLVSRSAHSLRWNLKNGAGMHRDCHQKFDNEWSRAQRYELIRLRKGSDFLAWLVKEKNRIAKVSPEMMALIYETLKANEPE